MRSATIMLGLFGLLLTVACVERLDLEDRPCPCASGYRCCRSQQTCTPDTSICPGGQACHLGCEPGQYCISDLCWVCEDNRHCGLSCTDCTRGGSNWACLNGSCGCRSDSDCPGYLRCIGGSCGRDATDGGSGGDSGFTDGSGGDSAACHSNKSCGPDCTDCTSQDSNWACLGNRCGCRDEADCPPDLSCLNGTCGSGQDGGM